MSTPFSVIMPFYKGDQPEHLSEAIRSVIEQTLIPDEVVLIQDGPVSEAHLKVVSGWKAKASQINHIVLEENRGLSGALNAGIHAASHEWLARMDADDICEPTRFEKQIQLIESDSDLVIIGSWIEEYDESMSELMAVRRLPETDAEIMKYARWRCPFNHMTVMYRKSILVELGAYKDYGAVGDDYELWARFIMNGHKTANLQESTVKARTGEAFFSKRRRGMKYFRNELREINDLYKLGLLKPHHYAVHFVIKAIVRLSPVWLVKIFYRGIRATS
ncbi:MAG: glycosyltransferase [Flavobacteriia bacterium]|nr:glycosyltransferase [Flavobacteriia bacterium]